MLTKMKNVYFMLLCVNSFPTSYCFCKKILVNFIALHILCTLLTQGAHLTKLSPGHTEPIYLGDASPHCMLPVAVRDCYSFPSENLILYYVDVSHQQLSNQPIVSEC